MLLACDVIEVIYGIPLNLSTDTFIYNGHVTTSFIFGLASHLSSQFSTCDVSPSQSLDKEDLRHSSVHSRCFVSPVFSLWLRPQMWEFKGVFRDPLVYSHEPVVFLILDWTKDSSWKKQSLERLVRHPSTLLCVPFCMNRRKKTHNALLRVLDENPNCS